MSFRTGILLLAVVALLASPAVVAQGRSGQHAMMTMMHDVDANDHNLTGHDNAFAHAEAMGHFGRLAWADGQGSGRFVTFGLNETTGALDNYTVKAGTNVTTLFSSVTPENFTANGTARATGMVLHLRGDAASLTVHNNPVALFHYGAGDAGLNVTVALHEGFNGTLGGNDTQVTVVATDLHGHLVASNGTFTLGDDNRTVLAHLGAGGSLSFLGHPANAPSATANLHAVKDALATGKLGAVTTLVNDNGTAVEDRMSFGVLARTNGVGRGHANMTLSSDDPMGKLVVVQLDGSVVLPEDAEKVALKLDGADVERANSFGAVVNASNGTRAIAYANRTAEGVQIVVYVPHFSDHELAITTVAAGEPVPVTPTTTVTPTSTVTPTPSGTTTVSPTPEEAGKGAPGLGLLAFVAAAAAVALVMRRR